MAEKANKITDEQLVTLQQHISKINQAQLQLGQVESQKYDIIAVIPNLRKELQDFQTKLDCLSYTALEITSPFTINCFRKSN